MVEIAGTDDELYWTNVQVMLAPSKLANGNGTVILSAPPAQQPVAPPAPRQPVRQVAAIQTNDGNPFEGGEESATVPF